MSKKDPDKPEQRLLPLHEIQAWQAGIEPENLPRYKSLSPDNTEVAAYMLAHNMFVTALYDIVEKCDTTEPGAYEKFFDSVDEFLSERGAVGLNWGFLQKNKPGSKRKLDS